MSLMSSQFGPDDMEALFWGPSILTADPLSSLLDPDEMMVCPSPEAASSPLPTLSPPSSQFSSTPPSSPTPLPTEKLGGDPPPLPWVATDQLSHNHMDSGNMEEDAFSGLDWMAETVDLNDFDLDSFISTCNPEDPSSSHEELVSPLDSLNPLPVPALDVITSIPHPTSPPALVPEVQTELEIKTEPPSPAISPAPATPASPEHTLELGSEVDITEMKAMPQVETPQVSRIVLSLSPTRIVLVLARPKQEVCVNPVSSCALNTLHNTRDSQKPLKAYQTSPCRPHPYPVPSRITKVTGPSVTAMSKGRARAQEKKQRKMEQNKTAAARYRQKKRVEQDSLLTECTELEKRNKELAEKADSITKEIQYLKELMDEVRIARQRKALVEEDGSKF